MFNDTFFRVVANTQNTRFLLCVVVTNILHYLSRTNRLIPLGIAGLVTALTVYISGNEEHVITLIFAPIVVFWAIGKGNKTSGCEAGRAIRASPHVNTTRAGWKSWFARRCLPQNNRLSQLLAAMLEFWKRKEKRVALEVRHSEIRRPSRTRVNGCWKRRIEEIYFYASTSRRESVRMM